MQPALIWLRLDLRLSDNPALQAVLQQGKTALPVYIHDRQPQPRPGADGSYVRRWLPELQGMSAKWIYRPWLAPAQVLVAAGVSPGEDYPLPIVDLDDSRGRALSAWEQLKQTPR
jgi:deoxyribodipyrimidine photolyase